MPRVNRKHLFAASLLVLATGVAIGQRPPTGSPSENWRTYKNEPGNFSVLFPNEPKDNTEQNTDAIESHSVGIQQTGVTYVVMYVKAKQDNIADETSFNEYKDAMFKQFGDCKVQKEGKPSRELKGYIGRGYKLSCKQRGGEVTYSGNLYLGKHYAYTVITMFPAGGEPLGVPRFTNSFTLLDS